MKKDFFKILLVVFFLSLSSHAATSCQELYRDVPSILALRSIEDLVAHKKNPFDVARMARAQASKQSDILLDSVTSRLLNENVIHIENLGGGVNTSLKITFESGLQAAYKPVNMDRPNQPIREVVAFRLGRLFSLDIVPPTVVRKLFGPAVPEEYKKIVGSVQLFVNTARPLKKGKNAIGEKILLKDEAEFLVENELSGRRLRVFDWLINNHDRGSNAGNYLVSKIDGYIIGIDHSVSFVGHDKQARSDKVPFYKNEFLNDPEFYEKLKSVSKDEVMQALGGLNPKRIDEFFERFNKLMEAYEAVLGIKAVSNDY